MSSFVELKNVIKEYPMGEVCIKAADTFYDNSNLMDLRIIGTLGLTREDVSVLGNMEGIMQAEGTYSSDLICMTGNNGAVVKVMSYPKDINKVVVKEGRAPEKEDECIVDTAFLEKTDYKIGDKITLKSGTEDDIQDSLKYQTYTITGSCTTSYYLSITRGTSSIGSGEVHSFIMIPKESFSLETFTEIYLTVNGAKQFTSYTKDYDNLVEAAAEQIKSQVKDERIKARYEEVIGKANDELEEAKEKLNKEEKKANNKLLDAKEKLTDAREQLTDGKKEIAKNEKKLEDAKRKIQASEQDITKGKIELKNGEATIVEKKRKVEDGRKKLETAKAEVLDGEKELKKATRKYNQAKKEAEEKIQDAKEEITDAEKEIKKIKKPKWYVLDRNSIQTYAEYSQDAQRIGAIGNIFPAIFF